MLLISYHLEQSMLAAGKTLTEFVLIFKSIHDKGLLSSVILEGNRVVKLMGIENIDGSYI